MALSEKLKQARLEAGMSQRALCGEKITRNMLSQIEHGSAHPSMDTLRYLAQRLGKPVSYFMEEAPVTSPNIALMEKIRAAQPSQALTLLGQFEIPDPILEPERWLTEALVCLRLAEGALENQQPEYARSLLERAQAAGARTCLYTPELERRRLLLCSRAGHSPVALEAALPSLDTELLLRAQSALEQENYPRCAALLDSCGEKTGRWHLLRGQGLLGQRDYTGAKSHFLLAEPLFPRQSRQFLEICCRELGDFELAYRYACLNREQE